MPATCFPKTNSTDPEEKRLASFYRGMQAAYFGKSNRKISQECVEVLESIPGWTWGSSKNKWQDSFDKYKNLFESEDSTLSSSNWFRKQRREYKLKTLSQEKISKLESIPNWGWTIKEMFKDRRVNKSKENLRYYKRYGKLPSIDDPSPVIRNLARHHLQAKSGMLSAKDEEIAWSIRG